MHSKTRGIAVAGVFGALQLVFILIGHYTGVFNLAFNLLAAAALMIVIITGRPQAFLCFIAVSLLSFAFTVLGCIPYVVFFGSWTLISVLMMEKDFKLYITLPIKIIWAVFVFYIGYAVVRFLIFDFTELGIPLLSDWQLCFLFVGFTVLFDYAVLLNAYRFLKRRFGPLINGDRH